MRAFLRMIIPAVFIVAAAGPGVQAKDPDYVRFNMPALSAATAASMDLESVQLMITMTDPSGSQLRGTKADLMKWEAGEWKDRKGNKRDFTLFPATPVDKSKSPRFKLDYSVSHKLGSGTRTLKTGDMVPMKEDFTGEAVFPLQPVIIDASGLPITHIREKKGLLGVRWQVKRRIGTEEYTTANTISYGKPQVVGAPAERTGRVNVDISFICYGGRKITWPDSGNDLRKSHPDLILKLEDPGCE